VIVLDTSVLVDGLTGRRESAGALRRAIEQGERLAVPSLVLYEWLRGPRSAEELADQEALFPAAAALPFGPQQAAVAAELYRGDKKPRGRELDLAIAACAIACNASLWTLNTADFQDLPRLGLFSPASA